MENVCTWLEQRLASPATSEVGLLSGCMAATLHYHNNISINTFSFSSRTNAWLRLPNPSYLILL
jgi:hypothetical protein